MALQIISPPAIEPISLQEAKDHLRLDFNDDDSLIESLLIPAARQFAEDYTHRALITQTLEYSLDDFTKTIKLPKPPLKYVISINYQDLTQTIVTLDPTQYQAYPEDTPAIICQSYGTIWPVALPVKNAIKIRYIAGYGNPQDIPATLRAAMLLIIGHLYENREENTIASGTIQTLPMGVKSLLNPHRLVSFS